MKSSKIIRDAEAIIHSVDRDASSWEAIEGELTPKQLRRSILWLSESPAHDRFREVAVELFAELQDLTTQELSAESVGDMVRTCDWVMLRTSDLKRSLAMKVSGLDDPIQIASLELPEGVEGDFDVAPALRRVGAAQVPAWAIAQLKSAGLTVSQIVGQWRGEITNDDVEEALALTAMDEPTQPEDDS